MVKEENYIIGMQNETLSVPTSNAQFLGLPCETSFPSWSPCWTAATAFLLRMCLGSHDHGTRALRGIDGQHLEFQQVWRLA